jgi:hypothetical protein
VPLPEPRVPWAPTRNVRVAHAAGMISTQTSCTMETAIFLLEKRADLIGCSVGDLATAVIARRVRFDGN